MEKPLHALVHTRDDRAGGDERHDRDNDDLLRLADGYGVAEVVQPAVDLQGAQSDGGGHAEQRADHRDDIDGLADRPVDAVSDERMERRTHAHRQPAPIDEVGER